MDLSTTFQQMDRNTIESYIALKQQEDLHLDFKTVTGSALSSRDDRRILAEAISGFANSDGGIVVWGVDARRDAQGVDAAHELRLLDDIAQFATRLNQLTGEASVPIVDGIQHRMIPFHDSKGCVATLVPPSISGPHMAKLGEHRYYKRSGHSFYRMEHFDLQDMFGRRQRADLQLRLGALKIIELSGPAEELGFGINNVGRAVAKHWGMYCRFEDTVEVAGAIQPLENLSFMNDNKPTITCSDNHGVIHPNGITMNCGAVRIRRPDRSRPLVLRLKLYCEGSPLKEVVHAVQPDKNAPSI